MLPIMEKFKRGAKIGVQVQVEVKEESDWMHFLFD